MGLASTENWNESNGLLGLRSSYYLGSYPSAILTLSVTISSPASTASPISKVPSSSFGNEPFDSLGLAEGFEPTA